MAVLNINIGILGHVDSGKTSLAKVLSSTSSTACFDRNPQSQERGITIDLGFSCLCQEIPEHLRAVSDKAKYEQLQYTFVDCPGHASLIRTIIGGAHIIDIMILVVDITKGIQTQTAECLVIGEILCSEIIVVLNKIDQIEEAKRSQTIEKVTKKIKLTLKDAVFKDSPIVSVAAHPVNGEPIGLTELLSTLAKRAFIPDRNSNKPAVFSVDHCFSIRGQGTVMTGTLWQGTIAVNDMIQIPSIGETKKVKSIQIYRKNVEKGVAGDRLALCVSQFDPKLLERGIVCTPGSMSYVYAAVTSILKVKYYKGLINSKSKFHISIGHQNVIAKVTIFCNNDIDQKLFDFEKEYLYLDSFYDETQDNGFEEKIVGNQFILLEFEKPILVMPGSVFIGSKLDMDANTKSCRIAFHGNVLESIVDKNYTETVLPKIKIFKNKSKSGLVDRIVNEQEVVCKNMFKKETRLDIFSGLKVTLSTGENGTLEGCFGQSGKIRVRIPEGLKPDTIRNFGNKKSNKHKTNDEKRELNDFKVLLEFRKYIYGDKKNIVQNNNR